MAQKCILVKYFVQIKSKASIDAGQEVCYDELV